jgi:hypothetical protein
MACKPYFSANGIFFEVPINLLVDLSILMIEITLIFLRPYTRLGTIIFIENPQQLVNSSLVPSWVPLYGHCFAHGIGKTIGLNTEKHR